MTTQLPNILSEVNIKKYLKDVKRITILEQQKKYKAIKKEAYKMKAFYNQQAILTKAIEKEKQSRAKRLKKLMRKSHKKAKK
jgi:hypothetical protein